MWVITDVISKVFFLKERKDCFQIYSRILIVYPRFLGLLRFSQLPDPRRAGMIFLPWSNSTGPERCGLKRHSLNL